MELRNFKEVLDMAKGLSSPSVAAVAGAADEAVIKSVAEARAAGIIEPILVGNRQETQLILKKLDLNPSDFNIVQSPAGSTDSETAVELIKDGSAGFLMKGFMETSDFLRPVVKKENGLRTGRTMSMVALNSFSAYHKLIINTDGGMCPYPTLQQKKEIIMNASETLHALGYELPKVACLCCKETYDPKMPETVDAYDLKKACEEGQLGKCFVEGPISYDIAMDPEAAAHKGFKCPHVGNFDIMLLPNIHTGNILGKAWAVSCHGEYAGIIVGSRIPIVMASRASTAAEKFNSLAIASIVAARNK